MKERITNNATDLETAIMLGVHINNPCVEPITGENIRNFYIY